MKKKTLLTLGTILLVFGLVGCGSNPTLKNGDEVVASVKGKKFSVEKLYDKLKAQGGETVLINMIDEYIVNKEVETDEDAKTYAESQLESYKSSYKDSGQDFDKALKSAGFDSEDAFKDYLIVQYKKKTIAENYVKEQITDSEIEKYYEDNIYGDIEVKHILISSEANDDATDEEKAEAEKKAKEKAEKLIKKLDKGANFEKLAKENSDDKGTASKGGKLTATYGDVVDEFWDAASKLKNKTYSKEPVKSEYGYHIIYRINQKDKPKLKAVKDNIIDKLIDEKLKEDTSLEEKAMIDIRKKYNMDIKDDDLKKNYNDSVKETLADKNSSN